jgi:hypothetical protein
VVAEEAEEVHVEAAAQASLVAAELLLEAALEE